MAPRDMAAKPAQGVQARTASNSGSKIEKVVLPLPPEIADDLRFEMELYANFMRHLRQVPNGRMAIKVLCSINVTAQKLNIGEDLVAKTLCDLGLRAPRQAFPLSFLDYADRTLQRQVWDYGAKPASILALRDHWDMIGETHFRTAVMNSYHGQSMHSYAGR